jgi:hypothetical protein
MKQDQKSQATTVTPELIFQVAGGFMAAKHLFVANEVGLFEQLADRSGDPGRIVQLYRDRPA